MNNAIATLSTLAFILMSGAAVAEPNPAASIVPSLAGTDLHILTVQDWGYGKRAVLTETAEGLRIEFNVDYRGAIAEAKAEGFNAFLPAAVVERVLPQAVLQRPEIKTLGDVRKISLDGGRVEIEANASGWGEVKAEFASDGRLFKLKHD